MMGWSYPFPSDNEKSYQSFLALEAMENKQDLILWPLLVIIRHACPRKIKHGHSEGIGNRDMDEQLKGAQSNSTFFLCGFLFHFNL